MRLKSDLIKLDLLCKQCTLKSNFSLLFSYLLTYCIQVQKIY